MEANDFYLYEVQPEQTEQLERCCTVFGDPYKYGEYLINYAARTKYGELAAWKACDIETGQIVATGGVISSGCSIGELWFWPCADISKHKRTMIKKLKQLLEDLPLKRIEAFADVDFPRANRFIQWLGLEHEGIIHRRGIDGKDQNVYFLR